MSSRAFHAAGLAVGYALLGVWVATAQTTGGRAAAPGGAAGEASSLESGAYSAAQATRGKSHYEAFCAACHLSDLSGSLSADTGAPPLRGAPFVASIEKKGIEAVFDYVKTTMPADDPATLAAAVYIDVLAYLIQANGFPAGPVELTVADLPRLRVRSAGL